MEPKKKTLPWKDSVGNLSQTIIYCAWVRSCGAKEEISGGNFKNLEKDLPRIASLGVDFIWLLPIYPIGKVKRKGSLGSPYAIQNYKEINPEFGTLEDFERFVGLAHSLNLKVMLDIVFNHTSPDSIIAKEHRDWFYQDSEGNPIPRHLAWSDVIDLNYTKSSKLWDLLIDVLNFWVRRGIDGFRCDVASQVPIAFWEKARIETSKLNTNLVWLAESNYKMKLQSSYFPSFHIIYDYVLWTFIKKVWKGDMQLADFMDMLREQQAEFFPNRYILRFFENHDTPRVFKSIQSREQALTWIAFTFFNWGPTLLYFGVENEARHTPSLFEREPIDWGDYSLQDFLKKLIQMKKMVFLANSTLTWEGPFTSHPNVVIGIWKSPDATEFLVGIFDLTITLPPPKREEVNKYNKEEKKDSKAKSGEEKPLKGFQFPLPDGIYFDLISNNEAKKIELRNGRLTSFVPSSLFIFHFKK